MMKQFKTCPNYFRTLTYQSKDVNGIIVVKSQGGNDQLGLNNKRFTTNHKYSDFNPYVVSFLDRICVSRSKKLYKKRGKKTSCGARIVERTSDGFCCIIEQKHTCDEGNKCEKENQTDNTLGWNDKNVYNQGVKFCPFFQ